MKRSFAAAVLGLCLFAQVASSLAAGSCSNCLIKSIGIGPHYDSICSSSSCAVVMMDAPVQSRPGCSVSSWNFAVDTSTADGRKALSFLLTAYTAGKAVNIAGTGYCSLWGDTESLLYAYFAY